MKCNICGNDVFIDMNTRKNVKCKQCGSLERTRLFWLHLKTVKINNASKILHLAPEKGLYDALSTRIGKENYIVADIEPAIYPFAKQCVRMDLCDLESQPSCEYDLILHLHVLEHTPCNIAYTLFHLHRMLKEDGHHIFVIPFMNGRYDECFQDLSAEERQRRFGQFDHVRRFGREDISSHLGKLVNIPPVFDATIEFDIEELRDANIPENHWRGFQAGTVLKLRKHDFRLQS